MICDKCGADKPDVMRRGDVPNVNDKPSPHLCTDCCSQCPGREWMKGDRG